jgi:hypothetical protein
MSIKSDLRHQSIVVLAENFNPSIFSSYWLIKNNFIKEKEILPESIFTPNLTQVVTKNYVILVTTNKLELNFEHEDPRFEETINEVLIPIIKRLKEVPYKGLGVNFKWFISDNEVSIVKLSRKLFFNGSSKFYNIMDSDDARYGAYFSKNYKTTRLKLDIKPITAVVQSENKNLDFILYAFNFHSDLEKGKEVDRLINVLSDWKSFRNESDKIINNIC